MFHQQARKLSYFVSEKKSILIVSLIGPLLRENALIFEECIKEVEASSAKWIILNFRDVPEGVDGKMLAALVRLQKISREKPGATLMVSSVHPELKKEFLAAGVLRVEELANNIAEALKQVREENKEAA